MEAAAVDPPLPARARRGLRPLPKASDEQLVRLVRGGGQDAFELLYDRYHAAILAFCARMLGSREDGEDATQQTFVAAYRDIVGSVKPLALRPWLYAIARHRCISMLRARRESQVFDELAPGPLALDDGLVATAERREELAELLADVQALPDRQRAALVLFELGDLAQGQIATVLECEPEQVKALVFQARTTLIQRRQARAIECREIREELASARGAALLRSRLRWHTESCPGCRQFAAEVKRQRADLALLLPILPSAGMKAATLVAAFGSPATHGATGAVAAGSTGIAGGAGMTTGTPGGGWLALAGAKVGVIGATKSLAILSLLAATVVAGSATVAGLSRAGHARPSARSATLTTLDSGSRTARALGATPAMPPSVSSATNQHGSGRGAEVIATGGRAGDPAAGKPGQAGSSSQPANHSGSQHAGAGHGTQRTASAHGPTDHRPSRAHGQPPARGGHATGQQGAAQGPDAVVHGPAAAGALLPGQSPARRS